MVTDMTLLQNAEFKEAFDEFDKVLCSSSSNTIENNTVLDGCSTVVLYYIKVYGQIGWDWVGRPGGKIKEQDTRCL